jgi:hypothetical protein
MTLPSFGTAICRSYYDKWRAMRAGTGIPALRDFLADPLPSLQPNMAILDVVDATTLRVRLFATRLADLAGIELTGANILDFAKQGRLVKQVRHAAQIVVTRPCGLLSVKQAASAAGRKVAIEMLALPLAPSAGGSPVIAAAIDVLETLERRDTVFGLLQYVSAEWVDIGHGVPAEALL